MLCWQTQDDFQPVPGAALGVHGSHPKGCLSPGIAGMASRPLQSSHRLLMESVLVLDIVTMTWDIHSEEQRNRILATPPEGCPSSSALGRQTSQEDSGYCLSTNDKKCKISMYFHQTGMELYIT